MHNPFKSYFKWKEPRLFLRYRDALRRSGLKWWSQPLTTLVAAGIMLLLRYLAAFDPSKHPSGWEVAISLALFFGPFVGYGIPWIDRYCSSDVFLREKILVQSLGRNWKYADIASFSWIVRDDFLMLILVKRAKGVISSVGAPLDIPRDAITRFLTEKGIEYYPDITAALK